MKPIPKELRAYFPAAVDDARPWWQVRGVNPGSVKWARNDGPVTYSDLGPEDRGKIDRADPLPPPPILVGQVWALQVPGSPLYVGTITHTKQSHDLMVGLSGVGTSVLAEHLINDGYLLSCPFGYAPWSGPEVT